MLPKVADGGWPCLWGTLVPCGGRCPVPEEVLSLVSCVCVIHTGRCLSRMLCAEGAHRMSRCCLLPSGFLPWVPLPASWVSLLQDWGLTSAQMCVELCISVAMETDWIQNVFLPGNLCLHVSKKKKKNLQKAHSLTGVQIGHPLMI